MILKENPVEMVIQKSLEQVKEYSEDGQFWVKCQSDDFKNFHKYVQCCQKCGQDHDNKYFSEHKLMVKFKVMSIDRQEFSQSIQKYMHSKIEELKKELNPMDSVKGSFGGCLPEFFKPDDSNLNNLIYTQLEYFKKTIVQQQNLHTAKGLKFPEDRYIVVNMDYITESLLKIYEQQMHYVVVAKMQNQYRNYKDSVDAFNIRNGDEVKQEVEEILKQIEETQNQVIQLDNQIRNIHALHEKLDNEKQYRNLMFNKRVDNTEFYDCQISAGSIWDLVTGKGWEIEYSIQQANNANASKSQQVVSFYGLYNKGKSFMASKLSQKELPRGYAVSTVGLSVLYPKQQNENQIIYLDTAGTETPICYKNDKDQESSDQLNYESKLKDRLLTEHLLQKFILTKSQLVIIVVDQLTKEEQRIIQKIKSQFKDKPIMIVHNFSKLTQVEDVENYIVKDILEAFSVTSQALTLDEIKQGTIYVEKGVQKIIHVVLAFEDGEAGKKYNEWCYTYLRNYITNISDQQKFNIVDDMTAFLKTCLKDLVNFEDEKFEITLDDVQKQEERQGFKNQIIQCKCKPKSLKNVAFDILGDIKVFKGTLNPKHYVFQSPDKEAYIVHIELSGEIMAFLDKTQNQPNDRILKCKISGHTIEEQHGFNKDEFGADYQYIHIRGFKMLNMSPGEVLINDREQGEFRFILKPDQSQFLLSDERPIFTSEQGILELRYQLQSGDEPDLY